MLTKLLELESELNEVVLGKPKTIRHLIAAFLAGGHILIEDVPGTGKTTLAREFAHRIGANFKRVQFTSDLLPSDLLGGALFDPKDREFHLLKGPIFTDILLADEINRASPKTQSALLEAMEEHQVSLEGELHPLSEIFTVLATENPQGFAGTHALPEAQLDRFMIRLCLGYLEPEMEVRLLLRPQASRKSHKIIEPSDLLNLRRQLENIQVHPDLASYLVVLGQKTRSHPSISLGLSPRALMSLLQFAKALAFLAGRDHLWPDDLKEAWLPVGSHRIQGPKQISEQLRLMTEILKSVKIPI